MTVTSRDAIAAGEATKTHPSDGFAAYHSGMVDDDQPETMAAAPPTEQAPAEPVPGLTAWSAEPDFGDELPDGGRSWSSAAGIAALIVVLGGVVAVLVWLVGRPELHTVIARETAPPVSSTTSPPTYAPPLPPAPTVTVTAEPSVPVATPESLPPDARFTQMLARDGVSNRHQSGAIATAKNVCVSIESGLTAHDFVLSMNAAGMPYREAVAFVRDAQAVYCPGAGVE